MVLGFMVNKHNFRLSPLVPLYSSLEETLSSSLESIYFIRVKYYTYSTPQMDL